MHVSSESDINAFIQIIESRKVFGYTIYVNVIVWSELYYDTMCFIYI